MVASFESDRQRADTGKPCRKQEYKFQISFDRSASRKRSLFHAESREAPLFVAESFRKSD